MRYVSWKRGIVIGLMVVIVLAGYPLIQGWEGEQTTGGSSVLALARPAFARTVGAQFPANEAGISAHINKGRTIDLERARGLLSGIWIATEDQVIGTVALPDVEEYQWPHAFISRDGWIVVYYPRGQPLSKLMRWEGWSPGDAITTTTLRDALLLLVRELGFPIARVDADMRYFHFQHPDATTVLIALDWTRHSDTFQYSIPADVILYGAGWSHRAVGFWGHWAESLIGETRLFRGEAAGTYSRFGHLGAAHLAPGTIYTATIRSSHPLEADRWVALALVFVYRPVGR